MTYVQDNSAAAHRAEVVRLRQERRLRLVPTESASPPPVEDYVDVPVAARRQGETLGAAVARVKSVLSRPYTTRKARADALEDLRIARAAIGQIEALL